MVSFSANSAIWTNGLMTILGSNHIPCISAGSKSTSYPSHGESRRPSFSLGAPPPTAVGFWRAPEGFLTQLCNGEHINDADIKINRKKTGERAGRFANEARLN